MTALDPEKLPPNYAAATALAVNIVFLGHRNNCEWTWPANSRAHNPMVAAQATVKTLHHVNNE